MEFIQLGRQLVALVASGPEARHPTKQLTLTEALRALGRRLVVAVEKAAAA